MNTFLNQMKIDSNITLTENGGLTRKSTLSSVLDMFALGAAYRDRSDEDVILLFKNAFEEDANLAMKCLFYLRDIREGQGERRFFRVVYRWLCCKYPEVAIKNLKYISEYGRWDDLIYATEGTKAEFAAFTLIRRQFLNDLQSKTPSLLGKWLPSINASSQNTKRLAKKIARFLSMSDKEYRKALSNLREKIKVLEKLMSENRWDEIDFSKISSKAGLIYRQAFARRDILREKYKAFANSDKEVNADALYPHDIARKAFRMYDHTPMDDPERLMLQKYWDNLRDFYNGREENGIAIVDVSGSMRGTPMEAAVSLGAYIADKAHGPFANHFITFSMKPELIKFEGLDIVDKFHRCLRADWGMNTNIHAVFDLLLSTAKKKDVKPEDMPTRLYIFSDMEFDACLCIKEDESFNSWGWQAFQWASAASKEELFSDLENIKKEWAKAGYKMPSIIFWNLRSHQNIIPAIGEGFSYVSGFSPVMIDNILSGKDGYDLMIDKLINSGRYDSILA